MRAVIKRKKFWLCLGFCGIILILFSFLDNKAPARIGQNSESVCLNCHSKLNVEKKKPFQHQPFTRGECVRCHNPHVSSHSKLLNQSIKSLCLECHKDLATKISKNKPHGALAKGDCLSCHNPHASDYKGLLKSFPEKLCISCHKEEIEKSIQEKVTHKPLAQGACLTCHDSHASINNYLLKEDSKKLCAGCHTPGCKVGNTDISALTSKRDCTSCHSGHASPFQKLLGPKGHTAFLDRNCQTCHGEIKDLSVFIDIKVTTETCLKCHPKDKIKINEEDPHYGLKENACLFCHAPHASKDEKLVLKFTGFCIECHEEIDKKINIISRRLKGLKKGVLRNRECLACHLPVHKKTTYLLRGDDPLGLKTCARCHPREHENTHPVGEKYKDPRNGKPLTCLSCHSMHDAKFKYLLTHDGDRELCLQCHQIP